MFFFFIKWAVNKKYEILI